MINTRDKYVKDTEEIIRVLSVYRIISYGQVYKMFPGKESIMKPLIMRLARENRIIYDNEKELLAYNKECLKEYDSGMAAAVWVLIDFLDSANFHTAGEYPVKIAFFADDEYYEIIHVPPEREIIINHVLSCNNKEPPKRIIIVDDPAQIPKINIDNTVCFCTVDENGEIEYYKLE